MKPTDGPLSCGNWACSRSLAAKLAKIGYDGGMKWILAMVMLLGAVQLRAEDAPAKKPKKLDETQAFFNAPRGPQMHVQVSKEDLARLRKDPRTEVRAKIREVVPGKIDVLHEDVEIHIKGGPGSLRSVDDKPALTLNFSKYIRNRRFHGLDKFHLNNSVQDPAYMCENLGGQIFRAAGIPAPRVTYAHVWLNDRDLGLYVLIEGFDEAFLRNGFKNRSGIIYQGAFSDIDGNLPSNAKDPKQAQILLKRLADAFREPDPAKRRQKIEQYLDVDKFLTFMALESMVAHWDGYCGNRNNYRIYEDPSSNKMIFLPHGMDQLFQRPDYPLMSNNGAIVCQALLATPEDRIKYFERIAELRKKVFDPQDLHKRIDDIAAHIQPVAEEISPDAVRQHKEQTAGMHQRIDERVRQIDHMLANPPRPLKFENGIASVSGWSPTVMEGDPQLDQIQEDGKPRLRIRCGKSPCAASFRATVLLSPGRYAFEGDCRTIAVVAPQGDNSGAGLRISGGHRDQHAVGNTPWAHQSFEFDVTEPLRDVVLVCELRANSGEAQFDPSTLRVRKK